MKNPSYKSTAVFAARDVDSNWSWVVCLASFLIQFVILGIQNSFGAFFIEFLNEFKHGESATAWIGSVAFGLTFMNGPLATLLCARWGSRTVTCLGAVLSFCGLMMTSFVRSFPLLFLTYGVVFGLGASFSYFASIAGLTSYFKMRLSLAYGITLAGSGAGTPVMVVLLEYMIKRWGWRATFQILSAIITTVFVGGLTYLPINPSKPQSQSSMDSSYKVSPRKSLPARACSAVKELVKIFDLEPFKDYAFTVWVVALGFCIFGYFIPFVFVIRIAKDIGVSSTKSTLLIAYLAITQTICKVVFGRLGDFAREKRITILQVILLLQAIATMLCPLASRYGYIVLVIYVVVFGFSDGCWSVMVGMGTELIVGKAAMPRAFGSLYGFISIPLIIGPPIAGVIFDNYGSYNAAFILAGSTLIIGIVLMSVVQRLIRLRPKHGHNKNNTEKNTFEKEHMLNDDVSRALNEDKRCLVPWDVKELYSRPSSLVISRVLEDLQCQEDNQRENLSTLANLNFEFVGVIDTCSHTTCHSPQKNRHCKHLDTEARISVCSNISSSSPPNSDSGRFSLSDESECSTLQHSRVCSTESYFVDDSQSCLDKTSCFKDIVSTQELGLSRKTSDCVSLDFTFDVFSNLMEQTLEAEVFQSRTISTKSEVEVPTEENRPICSYQEFNDFQETVI